jgi:nucleoside-diphosphate-sugar epimerase
MGLGCAYPQEVSLVRRVLVTGANGFVGSTVCAALSRAGLLARAAMRSPESLPRPLNGEVAIVGNIDAGTEWGPALAGMDAVVHLAGRVHVLNERFQDSLAEFRKVNVLGTERLARMAADRGVQRLIYASSIGVNGRVTRAQPFVEEDVPAPHNSYAISKWEAECVLRQVAAETGLEVVILRPPLVYGPGVKANFLRLMKLVDQGLPLPLGSVHNRRSLLYVGNLADAVIRCLEHPEAVGEVFLVSDGEDVSTPELVRHIAGVLHRPARLLPFPPRLLQATARLDKRLSAVEPLLNSLVADRKSVV